MVEKQPKKESSHIAPIEDEDKKGKAIELAIASIEKQFGRGAIINGGASFPDIDRLPSGSIKLDRALGGGYARGRIIELLGKESAGKTSISLHGIAEAQKLGHKCAFIDVENALDLEYATNLGVDPNRLLISQPGSGEEALGIVETLVRSGAVGLIVVDSVAALVPRVELEKNIGDSSVGRQAQLMSQACRMLTAPTMKSQTTVIFINQFRLKIIPYGNPEVSAGGEALKYFSSQRLDIRRCGTVETGDDKTGITTHIKVIKNKVGPPFKELELNILFGKGIDQAGELLDLAVDAKVIQQGGAWFSYKDIKLGQGATNAATFLRENPTIFEEIKGLVLNPPPVATEDAAGE